MEAVPRMPMLSFELKQSPEFVEFGPTLKQYIRDHYGEDPANYNKSCNELEQLRQSAVHVSQDFMGCSMLKKYYAQLQFLQGRFPMTDLGEASMPFTWEDVHSGREVTHNDIKFEQACILYNIGCLHSLLGALDTRQSADGMKVSCTHFQCAAWAFEHLRDHYGSSSMSLDMSHELLTFQSFLMLAQAQECILEKSMADSRKSSITAKVSSQIVEFYMIALKSLTVCNSEELISSKQFKDWKKKIDIKMLFYTCITNYYMGQQTQEQQKWGLCLAYYTLSLNKLEECEKLAKNETSDVQEALRFTHDVVGGKHQSAKKDNEFVYHELIPGLETLPDVKGAALVKGIPFNANDKEISGPDIFMKLVPMSAHEASSLYSEEKANLLRRMASEIAERDEELNKYLSSLQLDQTELNPEPERLPQQLLEKCAALSVRPNAIKDLVDSMTSVSNVAIEVELGIKEIQQMLQDESTAELEYQESFGKRAPNIILSEIAKECSKFEEGHRKGSQSNIDLHKAMNAHINNLKLLSSPLDDIQKLLPSVDKERGPESADVIKELNMLMSKVEEMREQRQNLEQTLRKEIMEDDITGTLAKQEGVNREAVFAEQLKKHEKTCTLLRQNHAAQGNILRALTDSNAKYATVRRATRDTIVKRDQVIRDLINSYDIYEDLMAKSQKGLEFYKKLEANVQKLLSRCRGVCKVQQEEREQIVKRYKPKVQAPTRPVAEKPPVMSGTDQDRGLSPLTSENLPSVTPMFDGPKLKDYLPFMKPNTFGKKAGSPDLSKADPAVQSYFIKTGSLPNSGTASPVHLPNMPGSVPASPDHFKQSKFSPQLHGLNEGHPSLQDMQDGPGQGHQRHYPTVPTGQGHPPEHGLPSQNQMPVDQRMRSASPRGSPQSQSPRRSTQYGAPTSQGHDPSLFRNTLPSNTDQYVPLDEKWKRESQMKGRLPANQPPSQGHGQFQNQLGQTPDLGMVQGYLGPHPHSSMQPRAPAGQPQQPGAAGDLVGSQYQSNIQFSTNNPQNKVYGQQPMVGYREITNTVSTIETPVIFPNKDCQAQIDQYGQVIGGHRHLQGTMQMPQNVAGTNLARHTVAQLPTQQQAQSMANEQYWQQQMQLQQDRLSQTQRNYKHQLPPASQGVLNQQSSHPVSSIQGQPLPIQGQGQNQSLSGQGQVLDMQGQHVLGQNQYQAGQGLPTHGQMQPGKGQGQILGNQGQPIQRLEQPNQTVQPVQPGFNQQPNQANQQQIGTNQAVQPVQPGLNQQPNQANQQQIGTNQAVQPVQPGLNQQPNQANQQQIGTNQAVQLVQPGFNQQPNQANHQQIGTNQAVQPVQPGFNQQPNQANQQQIGTNQAVQLVQPGFNQQPNQANHQQIGTNQAVQPVQPGFNQQPNQANQQQIGSHHAPLPQQYQVQGGLASQPIQTGTASYSQSHQPLQQMPQFGLHTQQPELQQVPNLQPGPQQSLPLQPITQMPLSLHQPLAQPQPTSQSNISQQFPSQQSYGSQSVTGQQGIQNQVSGFQQSYQTRPQQSVQAQHVVPPMPQTHQQVQAPQYPQSQHPHQNIQVSSNQSQISANQLPQNQSIFQQVPSNQARPGQSGSPHQAHSVSMPQGQSIVQPHLYQQSNINQVVPQPGVQHQQTFQNYSPQHRPPQSQIPVSGVNMNQTNIQAPLQSQQTYGPGQPQTSQHSQQYVPYLQPAMQQQHQHSQQLQGQTAQSLQHGGQGQGGVSQGQVQHITPQLPVQNLPKPNPQQMLQQPGQGLQTQQVHQAQPQSNMPGQNLQGQMPQGQGQTGQRFMAPVQQFHPVSSAGVQSNLPAGQPLGQRFSAPASVQNQTFQGQNYPRYSHGQGHSQGQFPVNQGQQQQFQGVHATSNAVVPPIQTLQGQQGFPIRGQQPIQNTAHGQPFQGQITYTQVPQPQSSSNSMVTKVKGQNVNQIQVQSQQTPLQPEILQPTVIPQPQDQTQVQGHQKDTGQGQGNLNTPKSPAITSTAPSYQQTSSLSHTAQKPSVVHTDSVDTSLERQTPKDKGQSEGRAIPASRQISTASSLDEILSSSPDTRDRPDSVLAPKVLTAQEIQQQKEDQLKNSNIGVQSKDPYKDRTKLDKFVTEVEKFAKFIDGYEKPSCSGPTPLDSVFKELMEEQEKAGRKQTLAIARCYPMKNRDQDIMPFDDSRVLISSLKDDYINASWINDVSPSCPKFIATQWPLPVTLVDFWLTIYEQGVEVIAALSSEIETGKKFPVYLPEVKGETIDHGPVQLTLQSVKQKPFWTERIIHLRHSETKSGRTLVHLHYNSWPVSGYPEKVSHLLQFITEVHSFYRQQRSLLKPIVVHCSNGVGRTGTFLLIYTGMMEVNHGQGIINLPEVAGKMLWKRRNLIHKKDQLKYCYDALLYYAQDVLAKQGILIHKASFGDELPKPGVKGQSWEPGEDILFGSISFSNLQTNIAKLGTKMDTTRLDQRLEMLKSGEEEVKKVDQSVMDLKSQSGTVLPDLVQSSPGRSIEMKSSGAKTMEEVVNTKEFKDPLDELLDDMDMKLEIIDTRTPALHGNMDSKANSLKSSPAHSSHDLSLSPQVTKKFDGSVSSNLSEIQDPSTFTIGTVEKNKKKKITKADFSEDKKREDVDPDDPLSSLDPFWTVKK